MKDALLTLICVGCGWAVPILMEELGIMKVGNGLAFVLIFTISVGLRNLCERINDLIVYLRKDKEEKEQIHLQRWRDEMCKLTVLTGGSGDYNVWVWLGSDEIEEICRLIDKLCKDKYVKIEDKKVFYDRMCVIWTKYGLFKGIYTIPPEIQKKWKKAQADDKLRQLKKDF